MFCLWLKGLNFPLLYFSTSAYDSFFGKSGMLLCLIGSEVTCVLIYIHIYIYIFMLFEAVLKQVSLLGI